MRKIAYWLVLCAAMNTMAATTDIVTVRMTTRTQVCDKVYLNNVSNQLSGKFMTLYAGTGVNSIVQTDTGTVLNVVLGATNGGSYVFGQISRTTTNIPTASTNYITVGDAYSFLDSPVQYYLDFGSNGNYGVASAFNASVTPPLTNATATYSTVTQGQYLSTFTFSEQPDVFGSGKYTLTIKAHQTAGTKFCRLTWEGYQFTNGAVYQDFETGANSDIIATAAPEWRDIYFSNTSDVMRVTNGVFGLKIRVAEVTGSGTQPTLVLYSGPDHLSHLHSPDSEGVWVTHLEFDSATNSLTAQIIAASNAAGTVTATNLIYNGGNTPNYAVAYNGYPKITLSTTMVTSASTAGTPIDLNSFTNAFDSNFSSITTTGTLGVNGLHTYSVDLGSNYSGYAVLKITTKASAEQVVASLGSRGATNVVGSGGYDGGYAPSPQIFAEVRNNASVEYPSVLVKPFIGQFVNVNVRGAGTDYNGTFWIHELAIYGVTNGFNAFSGVVY